MPAAEAVNFPDATDQPTLPFGADHPFVDQPQSCAQLPEFS